VDEEAIPQQGGDRSTAIRIEGASLSRRAAVQEALSAIVCGGYMDTAIASTHGAEEQHERYSPNKPIHLLPIATLQQVAQIDLAQGNPGNELAIWLLSGMGVDCKTANSAKMRMPTKSLEQLREDPAFKSIQELHEVYQASLDRQVGSVCGGGHAPAFFARTPLPFAHTPLHFACACATTHHPHNPPPPPPPRATRFCEQEKDAGKKIQADIDKQYDELIRQTEAMLVKKSSLVTNDTIAQSIVGVLCKSFLAAPNVKVVLVLNSCFSVHLFRKIQTVLKKNQHAGFIPERCCVLYTNGQWPGSMMPRLLHTILVTATASDATQRAMQIACLEALKKNTQSYAEAGCHGQSDNNTDPLEYRNLLQFGVL